MPWRDAVGRIGGVCRYAGTRSNSALGTLASSLRELIPSLRNTFRRCHSTVRGLRNSRAPISGSRSGLDQGI
jgi:hypothetical protein